VHCLSEVDSDEHVYTYLASMLVHNVVLIINHQNTYKNGSRHISLLIDLPGRETRANHQRVDGNHGFHIRRRSHL
jgi:hypothetical protein